MLSYNLPPGLTVDVSVVEVLGLHDAVGGQLVDVAAAHVRPQPKRELGSIGVRHWKEAKHDGRQQPERHGLLAARSHVESAGRAVESAGRGSSQSIM